MGYDIHAHVEIRYQGKWEHYSVPHIDRWYELFEIMSSVRRDVTPIVEPKGVPDDMSVITRLDWERGEGDACTASWFNEDEIAKLEDWLKAQKEIADAKEEYAWNQYDLESGVLGGTYMFGNGLVSFQKYPDTYHIPKGFDAVRLIFWFDNQEILTTDST